MQREFPSFKFLLLLSTREHEFNVMLDVMRTMREHSEREKCSILLSFGWNLHSLFRYQVVAFDSVHVRKAYRMNFRNALRNYITAKWSETSALTLHSNQIGRELKYCNTQNEWEKKKPGGFASLKVFAICSQSERRRRKKCMLHRNGLSKTDSNKVHFFARALFLSLSMWVLIWRVLLSDVIQMSAMRKLNFSLHFNGVALSILENTFFFTEKLIVFQKHFSWQTNSVKASVCMCVWESWICITVFFSFA